MRTTMFLILSLFLLPIRAKSQEIQEQQPDFISSRRTAALFVESSEDVDHIRYGRHPRSGIPTTHYIDFGYIGDQTYKYYLSCDRYTIYALPQDLPGTIYAIDICDYKPQGGWASESFIAQLRVDGGCSSCQ